MLALHFPGAPVVQNRLLRKILGFPVSERGSMEDTEGMKAKRRREREFHSPQQHGLLVLAQREQDLFYSQISIFSPLPAWQFADSSADIPGGAQSDSASPALTPPFAPSKAIPEHNILLLLHTPGRCFPFILNPLLMTISQIPLASLIRHLHVLIPNLYSLLQLSLFFLGMVLTGFGFLFYFPFPPSLLNDKNFTRQFFLLGKTCFCNNPMKKKHISLLWLI